MSKKFFLIFDKEFRCLSKEIDSLKSILALQEKLYSDTASTLSTITAVSVASVAVKSVPTAEEKVLLKKLVDILIARKKDLCSWITELER